MNRTTKHNPMPLRDARPKSMALSRRSKGLALSRRSKGFTLTELIVVIGIIVLLLGLIVGAVMQAVPSAERAATSRWMSSIGMAIGSYERDVGQLPPEATSDDRVERSKELFRALVSPGSEDGVSGPGFRYRGRTFPSYIETATEGVGRRTNDPVFVDRWQGVIDYRVDPDPEEELVKNLMERLKLSRTVINAAPFLLHSPGPDSIPGTNDDVIELGK